MNEKNQTFRYSYSAAQQEEIDAIRKKYLPPEEQVDKMEQLRRLDASVTRKGTIVSLAAGITGTLVMGAGMSLIMTDWGAHLEISSVMLPGLLLGGLGMAGIIAAYPLHQRITKKERERIAPEILKLTDELMQK